MERLARLFVGIGFLWVAVILVWGLAAGFDQPYVWYKWAQESSGWGWMEPTYLALAIFVVPMGMLVFLRDIFGDPVSLWVKWAAPGAFVAIYALFLLVALPNIGQPLFLGITSVVAPLASPPAVGPGRIGSNWDWLLRFAVAFAVLAGVPGIIATIVGMLGGGKPAPRRR